MDESADIIRSVASLLWPIVVIFVVLRLLPELRKRISSGDVNVKVGPFELSLQQASDSLRKQVKDLQEAVARLTGGGDAADAEPRRKGGAKSALPRASPRLATKGTRAIQPAVLWVDENPIRNAYEVAKLEEEGVQVRLARSVEEATAMLGRGAVDAVVTDANDALVREIRGRNAAAPVIVYATPERADRSADELVAVARRQ